MPNTPTHIFTSQIHQDVVNYQNRVTNAGGTIAASTLAALNEFVVFCYKNGLRDSTGVSHLIRFCMIFVTQSISGSSEMLWYPTGISSAVTTTGTPTYATTTGLTVSGRTNYQDTRIPGNTFNAYNNSLFIHSLNNTASRDYYGCDDANAGVTNGTRLLLNTGYSDNNLYYDNGNFTSGTGRVSAANATNNGLIVGVKNGATQTVYERGNQLVQNTTTATTGLTMPADTVKVTMCYAQDVGTANLVSRNLAGYGGGSAIPLATISAFTTVWNAVQNTMGR